MAAAIKAIVFKTPRLKETKAFFETILKFQIKESSIRHFVIYSKNIRIVFVETQTDFEMELYINETPKHATDIALPTFKTCKDPNGIRIIIA